MILFLLHSGCLINQSLYDRRYEELTAGEDDSAAPDDTACTPISVWVDVDGDGWGSPDYPDSRCGDLTGWAMRDGDCVDTDPAVNPGAVEVCDLGIDQDCDGRLSECRLEGDIDVGDADVTLFGAVRDDFGFPSKVGDLDGDGHDDLAIADSTGLHLVAAPGDGEWDIADVAFLTVAPDAMSPRYLHAVGADLDGDGLRDVAVSAFAEGFESSAVLVFQGGVTGSTTSGDAWIAWEGVSWLALGFSLAAVDDMDGDGLQELLLGNVALEDGASSVRVHQPGTFETMDDSLVSIEGPLDSRFGWAVAAGDIDGDRFPDLVVTSPSELAGEAYVYYGPLSDGGLTVADADVVIRGTEGALLGYSSLFDPILDVDEDGNGDLVVGAPGLSTAYLYRGPLSSSLTLADADANFIGSDALGSMISTGDVDGDGRDDIVFGLPEALDGHGVLMFYGPTDGAHDVASADVRTLSDAGETFGMSPGDLDGDGRDEVLAAQTRVSNTHLFHGRGD